jgi:3-oxoacyl-[acyl-carrier protein] reductase
VDLGIEGRTALVMGGSRGIGRGIAGALAREGARVAISSRSEESLRAAAEEIDGEVKVFPADSGDLDRLEELPGEVSERLGPIDILVANTGGPPPGGALDNSLEEWERPSAPSSLPPGCCWRAWSRG